MIWKLISSVLFLFDAESIHRLTVLIIRFSYRFCPFVLKSSSASNVAYKSSKRVLGMEFQSSVGLAAGFDKNAEILHALPLLGFGFAEVGTVTPVSQNGNPRPRLFRNKKDKTLLNRMGFNNDGAEIIANRVKAAKSLLPENFRVGVNIGKNKDTPEDQAHLDYVKAVKPFKDLVDFVVVNVSSPNTPGLRDLQSEGKLTEILTLVAKEIQTWWIRPKLFVKLAPEVEIESYESLFVDGPGFGLDGVVLTNTLKSENKDQPGGLSGQCLEALSRRRLLEFKEKYSLPVISVGGILSKEEAKRRMSLGADLIEIYSGWIFNGPSFPKSLDAWIGTDETDSI